jgi:spore maturation protein CgeB
MVLTVETKVCLVVCDQWLGSNGYAGAWALRRAGWSVEVVPEREYVPTQWRTLPLRVIGRCVRPFAAREFGAALERAADVLVPEFVLVFKGAFMPASALRGLRGRGIKSYCFYPDNSTLAHGPFIPAALPLYDWVFSAKTFGLRDMQSTLGVTRSSLLLHGFDPETHAPTSLDKGSQEKYGCDVSFIGTWSRKKQRYLSHLARVRPKLRLRVWGAQWERVSVSDPLFPSLMHRGVTGREYAKAICASLVNVAILSERRRGASEDDQITSRTFHIPACGAFMLHERTGEVLEQFEDGVHIGTFGSPEELVSAVDRYLGDANTRVGCAAEAQRLVLTRDSWDARVQTILDKHRELSLGA